MKPQRGRWDSISQINRGQWVRCFMVHIVTIIIFFSELIKLILEAASFLQKFTPRQRELYFNTVFWLLFNFWNRVLLCRPSWAWTWNAPALLSLLRAPTWKKSCVCVCFAFFCLVTIYYSQNNPLNIYMIITFCHANFDLSVPVSFVSWKHYIYC